MPSTLPLPQLRSPLEWGRPSGRPFGTDRGTAPLARGVARSSQVGKAGGIENPKAGSLCLLPNRERDRLLRSLPAVTGEKHVLIAKELDQIIFGPVIAREPQDPIPSQSNRLCAVNPKLDPEQ